MKPASPVIPGEQIEEIVYAENQPEYKNLPAIRGDEGTVLTRWHCDWKDRIRILLFGNVYIWVMTFNEPLQPLQAETSKPNYSTPFKFKDKIKDWFKWAFNLNRKFGWVKTPRGWLCWDFKSGDSPRIYWSKDATPTPEAGVRVILR